MAPVLREIPVLQCDQPCYIIKDLDFMLKSMLRKAVDKEGKDWDKLLPYLLFAYREMPQASTGFSPEASEIGAVESFAVPQTKKQVRAFQGLTGFYRKFIPKYAELAAPLTDLTKKNAPV